MVQMWVRPTKTASMLLNESFGAEKILRIGRDTISLTWIHVFLQTELLCFLIEARIVESLLEFLCTPDQPVLWYNGYRPEGHSWLRNIRSLVAYLVIFSVNIYFCFIMIIHGSTMSNEDIENWEGESILEIGMTPFLGERGLMCRLVDIFSKQIFGM